MKIQLVMIERSHPAKPEIKFRRVEYGTYVVDPILYQQLNDVDCGELWFKREGLLDCFHVGAVRLRTFDELDEIGAIVEVFSDEVKMLICEWCWKSGGFGWGNQHHDISPKEYIAWAKAHEVWP